MFSLNWYPHDLRVSELFRGYYQWTSFSCNFWLQVGAFLTWVVFIIPHLDFVHQWSITSLYLLISHLLQMAGSERNHTGSFSQCLHPDFLKQWDSIWGKRKSQSLPTSATRVVSQSFSCPPDFRHQNQTPAHMHQSPPGGATDLK